MSEFSDPELHAFEQALGQLQPAPLRWQRDQVLFEAGQAALKAQVRRWRALFALSAAVAVLLAIGLIRQHFEGPKIRYVVQPVPIAPPAAVPSEKPDSPTSTKEEPAPLLTSANVSWLVQQQILRTGEIPIPETDAEERPRTSAAAVPTAWDWHAPTLLRSLGE